MYVETQKPSLSLSESSKISSNGRASGNISQKLNLGGVEVGLVKITHNGDIINGKLSAVTGKIGANISKDGVEATAMASTVSGGFSASVPGTNVRIGLQGHILGIGGEFKVSKGSLKIGAAVIAGGSITISF